MKTNASDGLATVHVCYSRPQAEVFTCMLKAYGIPAFINGGETAAVAGHLIVALGGLEIRVPSRFEADALSLLAQVEKDDSLPQSAAFNEKPLANTVMLLLGFVTGYIPSWLRYRKQSPEIK